MEGVVLFETQSGALVFSRAFTDAFDLRHPRSERMNLAALLFALLNFAEGSMLDRSSRLHEPQSRLSDTNGPSICSFETSHERIVFAQTPSTKLVVALFTTAALDADVTNSLVHRLAYNYEHGDSLENRIAVILNQAPRLFRDALSRSIEEQVDDLLTHFGAQIGLASASDDAAAPAFVLFYFSDYLLYQKIRELADNGSDDGSMSGHISPASPTGPLGSLGFRSPLALGSPVSPRHASATTASGDRPAGSPSRSGAATLSFRTVYASTWSLFPVPSSRVGATGDGKRKKKKKTKKNAVMDHAEPQMFQRVVHCSATQTPRDHETPRRDSVSSPDAITYVIVPFVKAVIPLFFTGRAKHKRHASGHQTHQAQQSGRVELKHIQWTKFPLGTTATSTFDGAKTPVTVDLSAWKHGNCLVVYPERANIQSMTSSSTSSTTESESARLRRQRERKRTVVALFDALEPLVQAFMIGRT